MEINKYIAEKVKYLKRFNDYTQKIKKRSYEIHPDKLSELSLLRGIPLEILEQADIFYVEQQSELLLPEFIDDLLDFGLINGLNNAPIFHSRWVIPIKDFDGNVINYVGYSPTANERYLYGTGKYYDRKNDMYGMENYDAALKAGYAIYVEGITDCLAMRSVGFTNTFAGCGTMRSDIKMRHLNRMPNGVIFISDRDKAGDNAMLHWHTNKCVYISICIELRLKDIDDYINKDYDEDGINKYVLGFDSAIRAQRKLDLVDTINTAVTWLTNRPAHNTQVLRNREMRDYATLMLM